MELNRIINGDSIIEMAKMEPNSVDLIFVDPPYWMRTNGTLQRVEGADFDGCDAEWDQFDNLDSYEIFTREWLAACHRVLKPNGSIWVIGGMQCIYTIGAIMQQLGFWIINDVVWHKKNPTPNFKGTRLNNSHETLLWATKSKGAKYTFHYKTGKELNRDNVTPEEYDSGVRKQMGSVWRFSVCSGNERLKDAQGRKLHATQKPQELLERIIAISSNVGDVVLDPFGGTMTTAAAAKTLGRNYIMIEQNKSYCEYGASRLESIQPKDNDIARASYDAKPLKVTLPEMIEQGYLVAGEEFSLKNRASVATLTPDGRLEYQGEVLDIHTCAARAKAAKVARLNGFDCWYVTRNGKPVSIAQVREDFRAYKLEQSA